MSPVLSAIFAVVSQDVEMAVVFPGLTETDALGKGIHRLRGFGGWTGFGHYLATGDHGVQPGIVIDHHIVHVARKARHHRFNSCFHVSSLDFGFDGANYPVGGNLSREIYEFC